MDPWPVRTTPEQRAVLEVLDRLAASEVVRRSDDAVVELDTARRSLAAQGMWSLGVAESVGGGGADHATTALAIARVSAAWPAIGFAMAQVHAAGSAAPADLAAGRPVAVVEVPDVADADGVVVVERIDVTASASDLLVLHGDRAALVAQANATFGPVLRRTGLDGATTVPVQFRWNDARELDAPADEIRLRLYAATTAVAAGLVYAAASHAREYAAGRVQFGAPLTALPTMREQLLALRTEAVDLVTVAVSEPGSLPDAAALASRALDTAVDVAGHALQCFGGYGYLEEYPAAGLLRDAISLRAAAGGLAIAHRAAASLA